MLAILHPRQEVVRNRAARLPPKQPKTHTMQVPWTMGLFVTDRHVLANPNSTHLVQTISPREPAPDCSDTWGEAKKTRPHFSLRPIHNNHDPVQKDVLVSCKRAEKTTKNIRGERRRLRRSVAPTPRFHLLHAVVQ
jgi:hypothetical protein